MRLENTTPLAADLAVTSVVDAGLRVGCVTAKASYCFDGQGSMMLDLEHPFGIFEDDQPTELGLLPGDQQPRRDPAFEVVLLGVAHAPGAVPTPRMPVALAVGQQRQELLVTGDRQWQGQGPEATISAAKPFVRMPLTWERAYGGTAEVLIDVESPMDLCHPFNPGGRGFDPDPMVAQLAGYFTPPAGYPRHDYLRRLPNLEHPGEAITSWSDEPSIPACWATVPRVSPMQLQRSVELPEDPDASLEALLESDAPLPLGDGAAHRAAPCWVIPLPPREAPVVLEGMHPRGRMLLRLPPLRVLADYQVGSDSGTRELAPQLLVLLPEEQRLYLVFRHLFLMAMEPGAERAMRLRAEEGWYQPPDPDDDTEEGQK